MKMIVRNLAVLVSVCAVELVFCINTAVAQPNPSTIVKVIPGAELQGGIGNFHDPASHHGFALTLNGSIGITKRPNTFGYDAFSVNARWAPGTNKIGRKFILQFGAANWLTPALSSVYKDTVLTATEKLTGAETVSTIMAGLAFQVLNNRDPEETDYEQKIFDEDTNKNITISQKLKELNLELIKAEKNQVLAEEIKEKIAQLTWDKIVRPAFRKPSLLVGGMFRLGELATETDIGAADIFVSGATGRGLHDFVLALHYLKPLDDELIADYAVTCNLGWFVDLDDYPPINTLGITGGIGKYSYLEKIRQVTLETPGGPSVVLLHNQPSTIRYDVTLSFSGLFADLGPFGSGIAFRYSHFSNSATKDESQFVISFTTKFVDYNSRK